MTTSPLKLVLDKDDKDGQFLAAPVVPRWAFMKMAVSAKKGDELGQMAALYDLTLALIQKDERNRFDEYMADHDDAFENLQDAVNTLCEEITSRPLGPPSSSTPPSEPTVPSSRVVSFSRGTVEVSGEDENVSSTA